MKHIFTLLLLVQFNACSQQAKKIERKCDNQPQLNLANGSVESNLLTYKEDILPILNSTEDGRIYKCTVCHGWMKKEDMSLDEGKLVLESIQSGSMPRGDQFSRVNEEDLGKIILWLQQKNDRGNSDTISDEEKKIGEGTNSEDANKNIHPSNPCG